MPTYDKYHAKWKANMAKCSKYMQIPCKMQSDHAKMLQIPCKMTGSSSKLLQIQGKWYRERKPTKNPKPEAKKQDGSHELECIHVLGLRVKTSATGKRTFFSPCIVRAYRLSEGTWSTVHKRQLTHKDTHGKHRLKTVHISPVTSLQCGVESVECGV